MNIGGIVPRIEEVKHKAIASDADLNSVEELTIEVAYKIIHKLDSMLENIDEDSSMSIQDLKDITSMSKDVYLFVNKHTLLKGGGDASEGLGTFLSRLKA